MENQKYCNHQCNDNKFFDRLFEPVVQTQIRLLLEEPSDLDNTVLAWNPNTLPTQQKVSLNFNSFIRYTVLWDQDNSPQRQVAPRQVAPKKTRPKTTRPTLRRQLAPHSEDNSPHSEDNSPQVVLTCYNLKINLNSFRRPVTSVYRWVLYTS